MLNKRNRRLGIAAAAAVAAGLAWLAPAQREDLVLPAQAGAAPDSTARDSSRLAALPARDALGEGRRDLFGPQSWTPPHSRAAKAEAPPAPVAPPNPYTVAGTVFQDGVKHVYLANGDRIYEVRQGDELDGGYRVDTLGADEVVLLYVPLGKRESLPITATLEVEVAPAPPAAPKLAPKLAHR